MVPWGEQASAASLLLLVVPLVPESPETGKKRPGNYKRKTLTR